MWQRLYCTSFFVCQRVVSFLACYLATRVQKMFFKTFLSWRHIWIEKTAMRHATAGFFFFQGALFLKEPNSYISFPLSRCYTARKLPVGTCVIDINNCPTRCKTKQSIYYSASSLEMFRVSTTPIIRSTQNCNYNLRYWSYFCATTSLQRGQA